MSSLSLITGCCYSYKSKGKTTRRKIQTTRRDSYEDREDKKKRIKGERRKGGTEKERTNKYNLIWKVQNHKNEGFIKEEFEMNLEG